MSASRLPRRRLLRAFVDWCDSDYAPPGVDYRASPDRIDFKRALPVLVFHLGCVAVYWVGVSPFAVAATIVLYYFRIFGVTAFHHRYFSHKCFTTSRAFQFIAAVWAGTATQRGSLWWAALHRHHHRHSDEEVDAHSPRIHGFWWAHILWITSPRNKPTDYTVIPDLAKYPELVWLNRFDQVVPLLFGATLYAVGELLAATAPALRTNGPQLLVWGFIVGTVLVWHGTASINSLAHLIGRRRYATDDDSRNSVIVTILTFGDGWHNNHHRYQASARGGFFWWEIDPTYYGLKLLSWTGLIWNLKPVPESVLAEGRRLDELSNHTA